MKQKICVMDVQLYVICPIDSITMQEDREGFLYPIINEDTCIRCNKCI